MSVENSPTLPRKTWERSVEPVSKLGYMDGVADGQTSVYQQSFDVGFQQGLDFGLSLGFTEASSRMKQHSNKLTDVLKDPRKINCQMCFNKDNNEEYMNNLYSIQKHKNLAVLGSKLQ